MKCLPRSQRKLKEKVASYSNRSWIWRSSWTSRKICFWRRMTERWSSTRVTHPWRLAWLVRRQSGTTPCTSIRKAGRLTCSTWWARAIQSRRLLIQEALLCKWSKTRIVQIRKLPLIWWIHPFRTRSASVISSGLVSFFRHQTRAWQWLTTVSLVWHEETW